MTAIRWKADVSANFDTAADWSGGTVPAAADDAILNAPGSTSYTVTVTDSHTVNSIQTNGLATLAIMAGGFTATNGTAGGASSGTIVIGDGARFTVGGAFVNHRGVVSLGSVGSTTSLIVGAAGATFSGHGQIILGDNASNQIRGALPTSTLTNVDNTISGAGQLGGGKLTLINEAAGVIDATGASVLTLNTKGQVAVNDGLIEAAGAGGLTIASTTVNNAGGGVIEALAGSSVALRSADIIGGTLRAKSGGAIRTGGGGSVLDGLTSGALTLTGRFNIADGDALTVQGQIDLSQTVGTVTAKGKLNLAGAGSQTALIIGANNATLAGGQVTLQDNANNLIEGTLSGSAGSQSVSTLTNASAISGAGVIGTNLAIVNSGTIDATGANALSITPGAVAVAGSNTIVNTGTLEATNPGGLVATGGLALTSAGADIVPGATIANAGGTIEANGVNTHVDLYEVAVSGGVLETLRGGSINVGGYADAFDGTVSAVTNRGTVNVTGRTQLLVEGAIDNTGTMAFGSEAHGVYLEGGVLEPQGNATLTGGGMIALNTDHSYGGEILGGAGVVLTNVDNTISGDGAILLNGGMILVNQAKGVIDGSMGNGTLYIWSGGPTSHALINDGLIEATSAEGVTFLSGVVDNTGGGVILAATGSSVVLSGSTIVGGTLDTSGSGLIQIQRESVLDGTSSAVKNKGTLNIDGNQRLGVDLAVQGAISNSGTIALDADGLNAGLLVGAVGATLTGGGTVALIARSLSGPVPGNFLSGDGSTLSNVDNTIAGARYIGLFGTDFTLINQTRGVIDSTYDGLSFTINTEANTIANGGLIEATGGGSMIIQSAIANAGVIEANGGDVIVNAAVSGTGSAVIAAGTITFASSFSQNVSFTGPTGELVLAQSQAYAKSITGFSLTGGTSLDLEDIGFVSSEATFKGTSTSGTLTVTDGTHTAGIKLVGDYLSSTFTTSSDGGGGVIVVDPAKSGGPPPSLAAAPITPHAFVAAMAGFGAPPAGSFHSWADARPAVAIMLAAPGRPVIA